MIGGTAMRQSKPFRSFLCAAAAAAMLAAFGGCAEKPEKQQGIREFTGIYAAQLQACNEGNDVQNIIADKTGVILHQRFIAEQEEIDRIFSDMIVANKYPDFMAANAECTQKLVREGAFIPLDNFWDDYPNIKELFTDAEWDRVRSGDGHIYYIPMFSSYYLKDTTPVHSGEAFWVQVRVLEWAGYPELHTPDDYFDLLERYMEANPTDENGDPWYGYEIEANDAWFFALDNPPMFLDGYPNDGCCIVDPDTLTAKDYNLSPTAKKWFAKLNEEYKKGIIDPECFVLTSDQYYNRLGTGRVLGMVDQQWNFSNAVNSLPTECTYIPFGLTIEEGIEEHYRDRMPFNDSSGLGVSVSCTDPERAVQFISDLLEPEIMLLRFWGVEGEDYTVGEDGIFTQTEEQYTRWRDADYRANHICMYDYMPYKEGMTADGINAYNSSNQPNIFFSHTKPAVQKCFEAYGVRTYAEMLREPAEENAPWYPMWSYSNTIMDDTDYGRVMKQIDAAKHRYLPLLVMSDDFEATWEEYTNAYHKIDTDVYFDELTAEVRRRVEAAK